MISCAQGIAKIYSRIRAVYFQRPSLLEIASPEERLATMMARWSKVVLFYIGSQLLKLCFQIGAPPAMARGGALMPWLGKILAIQECGFILTQFFLAELGFL